MNYLQDALTEIETQQEAIKGYGPVWWTGEQLKGILRGTPAAAEIVVQDLKAEGMQLTDCEKKIAEFARQHRQGNTGHCSPEDADRIIREFYGISNLPQEPEITTAHRPAKKINFADFL